MGARGCRDSSLFSSMHLKAPRSPTWVLRPFVFPGIQSLMGNRGC
jgi:hypothetical protein